MTEPPVPPHGPPDPAAPSYGQTPQNDPGSYQPVGQGWNQQGWSEQSTAQPAWQQQPSYGQPPYNQWGPPPVGYGAKEKKGMAIAAMVLGIVALLASIGPYIAFLPAVLALIFGIIAVRRPAGKGMAIAGIVLGSLAIIAAVISAIFWTNVFRVTSDCLDQYPAGKGEAFNQCIEDGARGIFG